jgi:hypothetical protein
MVYLDAAAADDEIILVQYFKKNNVYMHVKLGLHLDTCIRTCMIHMSSDKMQDITPYKCPYILNKKTLTLISLDTFLYGCICTVLSLQ